MHLSNILSIGLLSTAVAAGVVKRQDWDPDFDGRGKVIVVSGKNINTVDPNDRIGCVTAEGRFVTDTSRCGVFTMQRNSGFSSTAGVCTFEDASAEPGRPIQPQPYALKCRNGPAPFAAFFSEFGSTSDAGPGRAWIFTGNYMPYYEAKKIPSAGEAVPLWYYTWGDEDSNDRVYFHLMFEKI